MTLDAVGATATAVSTVIETDSFAPAIREGDKRFTRFLLRHLAVVEATGCLAERKFAAGVRDLYAEWDRRRGLAEALGQDPFGGETAGLDWALRCLAHSAWSTSPGWEPAFCPVTTCLSASGASEPARPQRP
ncbi:MAG TPA: hypothetical protein VIU15_23795 [Streptomyces sp.]